MQCYPGWCTLKEGGEGRLELGIHLGGPAAPHQIRPGQQSAGCPCSHHRERLLGAHPVPGPGAAPSQLCHRRKESAFTASFKSWEREVSHLRSHSLWWQHWDPSPCSGPPSRPSGQGPCPATPPARAPNPRVLAQGLHRRGHFGLISGAWSWGPASAWSKRSSPPWSMNRHHNPAKQRLDSARLFSADCQLDRTAFLP